MEIDRTSHSYLLGQTEYRLSVYQAENERLREALEKIARDEDTNIEAVVFARNILASLKRWT